MPATGAGKQENIHNQAKHVPFTGVTGTYINQRLYPTKGTRKEGGIMRTGKTNYLTLSILLACYGGVVLAETGDTTDEVERLRAQVEKLQENSEQLRQRYEAQNRVIEVISERLEELETPRGEAPARQVADSDQPDLSTEQLERIAGRGVEPAAATSPGDTVVREAQPSPSVQNILREEHTLFSRRLTIEPGITYAFSDRRQLVLSGFLALDAIFLGTIDVDTVKSDIVTFDLSSRYGFTDRLEGEVNIPFIYRNSKFQSGGVGGAANAVSEASVDESGLGDISASLYYRLFAETQRWPDVVMNVGFRAPTGKDPFGIGIIENVGNNNNLNIPEELPTGNGVWALTGGFSFLKTIDPAIVFANIGYTYNIENSFDDISADDGRQPGDVKLGDSIRFGFGTAFALNERFSLAFSYAQQFTFESEITPDGQPKQDVVGSDANVATFNIGATYALSNSISLVSNIGVGLTNDASDVTVTFRVPFQF